jgi:hypothetical protein
MVTRADRHNGQRGIKDLSGRLLGEVGGVTDGWRALRWS